MNPQEELYQIIDAANLWSGELTLERSEYLKVAGSKDTNLYYVTDGSLRIFLMDASEEHTIRFGYKDNFITAIDSFIMELPSEYYIQALRKTTVRVIPKERFIALMESSDTNMRLWNLMLSYLVVQQMEREHDILISSPVERYKRVLERSPRVFQEVPHKYIASYLRMSPETLSRIKKS